MNEKIVNEIIIRLDAIGEKLGVASEHLWNVLIKQAYISSISSLVVISVFSYVIYFWYALVKQKTKKPLASYENRYPSSEWEEGGLAWASFYVMLFFGCMFLLCIIPDIISGFFNPEFKALKFILDR